MENRIKECQLGLFSDRTSCQLWWPNQFRLLLQVQGMVAEHERAKILERSRRGKRHKAQTGQVSVLSGAPYGYRCANVHEGAGCARYDIVEEHAQVVRHIFQWVGRERATIGEVCRRLDTQKIPTPHGKTCWDRTTVWGILKNPAYCGQAAFGKTRVGAPQPCLRPQRHQRLPAGQIITAMPADQWQTVLVPALIDADLFAAVQAQYQQLGLIRLPMLPQRFPWAKA